MLTPGEQTALNDLQWHWGEVYAIGVRSGKWFAICRITGETLEASDHSDLRQLIRNHYARLRGKDC